MPLHHDTRLRRLATFGFLAAFSSGLSAATDSLIPPGLYAVKSQMVMPHLDEMRRLVKTDQRCVTDDPAALFPVLRQDALHGCKFDFPKREAETLRYVLMCQTARVATGEVIFETALNSIVGTMKIKMGGKNMTFTQRVEAKRLGDCPK